MIIKKLLKIILVASIVFAPSLTIAESMPDFPMSFWGTASINGIAAPAGSIIKAYYGTNLAGEVTLLENGIYGYTEPVKQKLVIGKGAGQIKFTIQSATTNSGEETDGAISQIYPLFTSGSTIQQNLNFTVPATLVVINTSSGGGGGSSYAPLAQVNYGGPSESSYVPPQPAVTPASVGTPVITPVVTMNAPKETPRPAGQVLGVEAFAFSANLTIGSTGEAVTELQNLLAKEGFFNQSATGYFGQVTKNAVIAYQKAHNIDPVSGFVGPLTRAELNKTQGGKVLGVSRPSDDVLRAQIAVLQTQLIEIMNQLMEQLKAKQ